MSKFDSIKMTESKNKVSSVTHDSDDDSIKATKKNKASKSEIGESQDAKMEVTKSQFQKGMKDDHFGEGDREIQYELVNNEENEKLVVRKFT